MERLKGIMNLAFFTARRCGGLFSYPSHWASAGLRLTFLALLFVAPGAAHDLRHGNLQIGHAWAKPVAKDGTAEVYFAIVNRGKTKESLVGAQTAIATQAALAETQGASATVLRSIELAPSRPVALRPGRLHVRLKGLTHDLAAGDSFPLTLAFADAPAAEVTVIVEASPSQ